MASEASAGIENDLLRCATIANNEQRLACFDSLASEARKIQPANYIQPPERFLKSELRVNPKKSEYKLNVSDFVGLIKAAKMENGQRIKIFGWLQEQDGYTLVINMRSQTKVRFKYFNNEAKNYSVLQPVTIDSVERAPSVFIYNVAAMSP